MTDVMIVPCSACGHRTQVPPGSVGRKARCQCGFSFRTAFLVNNKIGTFVGNGWGRVWWCF